MTEGQMLFWSGIGGTVFFTIMFIVCWLVYDKKKKKLMRKIENEIEE